MTTPTVSILLIVSHRIEAKFLLLERTTRNQRMSEIDHQRNRRLSLFRPLS
jgi:hypothetical protein